MGCKDFYLDVYFIDIGEEILNSIFIFYIMKHHKALPLRQLRSNWTDIHHMAWPMVLKHKVSDYFVYGIYTRDQQSFTTGLPALHKIAQMIPWKHK